MLIESMIPTRSEVSGSAAEQLLAPQHSRPGLGQGRDAVSSLDLFIFWKFTDLVERQKLTKLMESW